MRTIAVIPARYASLRFPGKPLCMILGKPMIAWVVDAALKATLIDEVCVATDDERIAKAGFDAGAKVIMTPSGCASGTDRVAAAAHSLDGDVYLNLQGDEPTIDPADIDALASAFRDTPQPHMATLSRPLTSAAELHNPDVVKVVTTRNGDALYFSRSAIPHYRDHWSSGAQKDAPDGLIEPLAHIGVYGYTASVLGRFAKMLPGELEKAECLEQLRALEAGWRIRVVPAVGAPGVGVDRPEDVARAEKVLLQRSQ